MADPFVHMAETLTGTAPPAMLTRAETTAARVRCYAEALRRAGDPETKAAADALETWLTEGGDLAARLQLRVARGRRFDLPAVAGPLRRRDDAIRKLAADVYTSGMSERAHLARLGCVLKEAGRVAIIRETTGAATVPTSASRLRAIIRAA